MAEDASPEARRILRQMGADFAARATSPSRNNHVWYVFAGGALVAAYAITTLYLKHSYVERIPKGEIVVQLFPPFEVRDHAVVSHEWKLAKLAPFADEITIAGDARSPIVVYEDDKPLGPGHRSFADIASNGGGRFAHFKDYLIFSTSDNSDPTTNGRTYWAVKPR